jgi:hypothetical protein
MNDQIKTTKRILQLYKRGEGMSLIKGPFIYTLLPDEIPFWKIIIWCIFGKRVEHTAEGYHVVGYLFRGKHLIVECEAVE